MANKKFNIAKVFCLILLCFGITFFSANNSQAVPIDVYKIKTGYPAAGGYLTQYWLETEYGELDAFCVEEVGIDLSIGYELVPLPAEPVALIDAAKLASQYYYGDWGWDKWSVQIAIWTLVFEGFSYDESYFGDVATIIDTFQEKALDFIGPVSLVQSPIGGDSGPSQDYLVKLSVPDAAIMLLLGPALLGLGLLGRRRRSEN